MAGEGLVTGTVLVTGATGKQGGATVRALLARGWPVRALVRNPQAPAAARLAKLGATLVAGDLDDPGSLRAAMAGVHGVFSVQTFMTRAGLGGEVRWGRAVADATAASGVAHVVYSSVGGAERASGIPHFDSKWAIEEHLRSLPVLSTVLRPAFFMDNFAEHPPEMIEGTLVLRLALRPDTRVQLIAAADIGAFAALAFSDPGRYGGAALELAGDELTGPQIAAALGTAGALPARFEPLTLDQVALNPAIPFSHEIALMFEWFQAAGYAADIPALRAQHRSLLSFGDWLHTANWPPR